MARQRSEDDAKREEPAEDGPTAAATDWLERIASAVSALLVAGLFALLVWDAVRHHSAAEFTARVGEHRAVGEQHYLAVSVENTGDRAVRDVEVSVTLAAADSTDEATFTIDWLPGKSTRHGMVILPRDPSGGRVRAAVTGFAEP
jgi:uncharacterized protein (TIGR02588 family)